MESTGPYKLVVLPAFDRAALSLKKKNPAMLQEINRTIEKILREPTIGKPLRHILRNYRRLHVAGSFVLLYEIDQQEIRLIDFDHHDRIYKKY